MAKNDFVTDEVETGGLPAAPAKKARSFYDVYTTDTEAETGEGITLDYGDMGKITIHRAGGSNRKFINYVTAKMKPYNRQVQAGTMDPKLGVQLSADIYAKTVIIGWEGVRGRDGEVLPFTYDNVVKLLIDLPELFNDIQAAAQDAANFRAAVNKDVEGN